VQTREIEAELVQKWGGCDEEDWQRVLKMGIFSDREH
jgi:hypothetical protein